MPERNFTIRPCTVADAAIVAGHRLAMFRDMGQVPSEALAARLREASAAALEIALGEGTYVGWFALDGEHRVIAGAGAQIKPQLPRFTVDGHGVADSPTPLVVNVYTEPPWRRRGIARVLMQTILDWALAQGFDRVSLHASDAGRALYQSLGFEPTNEMRWSRRWDLGHDD